MFRNVSVRMPTDEVKRLLYSAIIVIIKNVLQLPHSLRVPIHTDPHVKNRETKPLCAANCVASWIFVKALEIEKWPFFRTLTTSYSFIFSARGDETIVTFLFVVVNCITFLHFESH